MTDESRKYFDHFYRIWEVGPSWQERIDFWRNRLFVEIKHLIAPDQERLDGCEIMHLQMIGLADEYATQTPAEFPTPHEIFIEKFYWERGVGEKTAARLRYFKSHYPEHFVLNSTSELADEKILSDCELGFIVSGHEYEIDPEANIC